MKKLISLAVMLTFTITISFAQGRGKTKYYGQSRSAKTGRYVTKSYADKNKSTTYTTRKRR